MLKKHTAEDAEEADSDVDAGETLQDPYEFSEEYLEGLWNPQVLKEHDSSCLPPKLMLEDIYLQLSVLFSPEMQKNAARCDKGERISEPSLILYCPLEGGEYVVDATVQAMAERFNAEIQMLDLIQLALDEWSEVWTDVTDSEQEWTLFAGQGYFSRYPTPDTKNLQRLANQLFSRISSNSNESKDRRRIIYIRDTGVVATLTPALYAAILGAVQPTLLGSDDDTDNSIPTAIILGASPLLIQSSLFQQYNYVSSTDKGLDSWDESDHAQAAREKRNQHQYKSLKNGTLSNHVENALSSTSLFSGIKETNNTRYRYSRIRITVPTARDQTKERMVREKIRFNANLLQLRMALLFKEVGHSVGPADAEEMVRLFKERSRSHILTIVDMRPIYERAIEVATGEATTQDSKIFVTWDALVKAQEDLNALDQERSDWVDNSMPKDENDESAVDPVVEKVKAMCLDTHESELLQRVVKPGQLKTTFDSVHLPTETIDVTGLLKEHNMTGALFFGPPGTGKTNLVRAIAKESGSRMISVKPSDILNKWVGESEKIVDGLFSLARRLKPCIIFIDEIDSLFGTRSSNDHSPWRNDLLTQFAQEMDGMYSSDVVVIGTTNRPFGLDDAMLRRLPCRILIDLPDEAAREAILKILLKNEQLESNVDLKDLARQTARYSGSDLKNVCVMAAYESAKELAKVPWKNSQPEADMSTSDHSSATGAPPTPPDSDKESATDATEHGTADATTENDVQGKSTLSCDVNNVPLLGGILTDAPFSSRTEHYHTKATDSTKAPFYLCTNAGTSLDLRIADLVRSATQVERSIWFCKSKEASRN
ncbi:AAA family ATPase [Rhizoctonia solani AG-3 Rhs1AP]|uniref:AAA family ATPase n=2 Tax=Rhizoctonia solani AG-3 TaxID=1086053 RepID=A0A074S3X0_9AGAM|nr:AAA family ATPase [Rhizoctonia solani AG-3 Rhs1AP]KEP51588.1 AAA family ATPase [Rhizoctonia solani 123E]